MSIDLPETERWLPMDLAPRNGKVVFALFDDPTPALFGLEPADDHCFVKWVDTEQTHGTGWWWCDPEGNLLYRCPTDPRGFIF